ncbi:MAG: beta-ketoacyl-[acyl-carrier-protein] synthase II [Anaerolineae bacterium]|nr:MAG: beta-ketoacyl-[acyl-carrier-protein] synthase II [Anaerolineae bacterium]
MNRPDYQRPNVVITGMGVISVLGNTIGEFWNNLIEGKSGISRITAFDASGFPCQIAGEIRDFDPGQYMEIKEARRMPRSSQMALAAAIQAVRDAGLPDTMPEPERAGVMFGTAMGGVDFIDDGITGIRAKGYKGISPFTAGGAIPNFPAFMVSKEFQCLGPNNTTTTACAAGTQAVGEGAELIRRGAADLVIVGGTEAFIRDFGVGGFAAMRALPTSYNDDPEHASRPFDAKREGFILSEGAAALVLESEEHAKARGARVLARLLGQASSSDGYHVAAPDPDNKGKTRAMRWALDDASLSPDSIDYINAHGTSTEQNDASETQAIKTVFGDHAYKLAISSTKSMMGHAMGASGALETVICVLAIQHGMIPPTINLDTPDPECDLDYTPNTPRKRPIKTALSNSFGLGGQNAVVIVGSYD